MWLQVAHGDGIILPVLDAILSTAAEPGSGGMSQFLAPMLVLLGIVIIIVMWMVSARTRSARRGGERLSPREQIDRIKAGHRTRESRQEEAVDFVRSAQEIAARIDNKCERLEQLLAEADERIAKLKLTLQSHQDCIEREPDRPRRPSAQPVPVSDVPDPLKQAVYELADAGRPPVEIARQLDEQVGKVELILALRS